ncbi:unnamed protein product, partial [marine sediment metagenome]
TASYSTQIGGGSGLQAARGYEAKIALLGDGEGKVGCHSVITSAAASYLSKHGPNADREALKADIRSRAAEAPWDRSRHSEEYVAHEISDEVLDRSIQDWIDKALPIAEPYEAASKDDTPAARDKVERAVDQWISDADRWHGQHEYRQAMLEGRLRLIRGADGKATLSYDGEPGSGFWTYSKAAIRAWFPPPRHGLNAQVGLGKTKAFIERLPLLLERLRPGHCILIAVPNHRLSRELRARIKGGGLDAEIFLGPAQPDPDQP